MAVALNPDPVAVVDVAGSFVAVNEAWRRQLGHDPSHLSGGSFGDVLHPDDLVACLEPVSDVARRHRPSATFDCRVLTGAGTWRWFEWRVGPSPGRQQAFLWGRDVDRRRTAEERNRLVLEHAPDLVAVVNADGQLMFRAGGSSTAAIGHDVRLGDAVLGTVHPDDLPIIRRQFERAVGGDVSQEPFDVRVRRADGSWGDVEFTTANCVGIPAIGGMLIHARDVTARRQGEAKLRAQEAILRRLVDIAPLGLFEIGGDGRLTYVNRAWSEISGLAEDAVVGRHWTEVPDASIHSAMRSAGHGWTTGARFSTTAALVRPDGQERWVRIQLRVDRTDDGSIERYVGSAQDVTASMQSGEATGVEAVLEATPDLVLVWDAAGRILYANASARRTLGLSRLGLIEIDDVYVPWARQRLNQVRSELKADGTWSGELAVLAADGRELPVSQVMVHHRSEDGVDHISAVARDITDQKQREAELAHQATHDPLTALPNRVLFLDRLRQALRRDGVSVAVAFLDVDRFKLINDSLGHDVGDQLLIALGRRLEGLLRPSDVLARLGGDEFVVMCEGIDGDREAMRFAERIRAAATEPFHVASGNVFVTTSVGVAVGAGISAETLMENADVAMYRAKDRGRGRSELFDAELRTGAAARLEIETALREGLERQELRVFYQPQYCLRTGRLVGVEALVRWLHPGLGLVSPMEFIPVGEESGLIVPVGAFVLEEACARARAWEEAIPSSAGLDVYVNLSARQFSQPDLVDQVASTLRRTKLAPGRLCLEITESAIMGDIDWTIATLLELRALGVKVGIDDFGTGYSSLSYLRRLPVDVLKIDKSFISRLGEDIVDSAIVSSVINLARSLGMAVVAEGVETEQQRQELRALGCSVAQGYYFSRPLAPEAVAELMASEVWQSGA